MDRGRSAWSAAAAYLYLLGSDEVSLAWEYLRRNASYQSNWRQAAERSASPSAHRWGLLCYEDPRCDSRLVEPQWHPLPPSCVLLTGYPRAEAARFQFWSIPGRKSLVHDGHAIQLTARSSGVARAVLAPDVATDEPYSYSVPADCHIQHRCRAVNEFAAVYQTGRPANPKSPPDRPGRSALMHMRVLQAFDGAQSGATHRQIAVAIFGTAAVRDHWTTNSELRAQIRYLIRRGQALSEGGYRSLLNTDSSKTPGETRADSDSPCSTADLR